MTVTPIRPSKPCPFCNGNIDDLLVISFDSVHRKYVFFVYCPDCEVEGPKLRPFVPLDANCDDYLWEMYKHRCAATALWDKRKQDESNQDAASKPEVQE